MKRIIVAEGDGRSVRRVAKKYTAQVRIYAETDYNNRPALELTIMPDGTWCLTSLDEATPGVRLPHIVAAGQL